MTSAPHERLQHAELCWLSHPSLKLSRLFGTFHSRSPWNAPRLADVHPGRTNMQRPYFLSWLLALSIGLCGLASAGDALAGSPQKAQPNKVVVFVWDGLRPDAITASDTPHLHRLKKEGVEFAAHHSTYPTFTLMNGASLATGAYPGTSGFYGNTLWQPGPTGKNQTGASVDFNQPVFTEDYAILRALDAYYGNRLLLVETLFQAAQKAGFTTAAIGKSGPAFLQDRKQGGLILLETMAYPQSFVHELQAAGFKIPKHTALAYPPGTPIAS